MNLQHLVAPAMIAAGLHVALLFGFPEDPPIVTIKQKPVVEKIKEMPTLEMIEPPPADKPDVEQPVKPLSGGSPRPELPDILQNTAENEFTIKVERTEMTKVDVPVIGPKGPLGEFKINGDPHGKPTGPTLARFLDKQPRAKVQMPPDYPASMKHDGLDGTVTVEFEVDVKGRVVSARVRESTHRAFEEPTIRAVLQWRFEPGLSQGRVVPFRMVIPVNFNLGAG